MKIVNSDFIKVGTLEKGMEKLSYNEFKLKMMANIQRSKAIIQYQNLRYCRDIKCKECPIEVGCQNLTEKIIKELAIHHDNDVNGVINGTNQLILNFIQSIEWRPLEIYPEDLIAL